MLVQFSGHYTTKHVELLGQPNCFPKLSGNTKLLSLSLGVGQADEFRDILES